QIRSAFFAFSPKVGDQILLKVAISYVSIEGARENLEAELPGWDFDKVRADAKAAWNKELSKIEVSGGTDDQTTTFYTALYHTMIHPSVFNDVDGSYRGHDGKVHSLRRGEGEKGRTGGASSAGSRNRRVPNSPRRQASPLLPLSPSPNREENHYTVFSLWDTFRAAHPLYTIIDQKRTVDFINTFIRIYEQGGRLPVWELWGEETDTMIGYHAVSVIADAIAKGIKGFDYEKAYAAAKHSAELDHFGLAAYKKRGYISMEDENESVSKTLEYAYDDWCIAQMLRVILKRHPEERYVVDYNKYLERARYFENLFDPGRDFFVPRKNGTFVGPFAPNEVTFSFTEGNSWQYSFFVPHDIDRLIELMGPEREYFAGKLVRLFTTEQRLSGREQPDLTGLIGQYAHGNEPSHHIPYLFNYAALPWRTQMYVRKIMDEFYKNSPDGLIGNEDCGQMSAWYVLSATGFYPVTPGSPEYSLGTPLFPEVKYRLENGRTFTVRAKNISEKNIYVSGVSFNGTRRPVALVSHANIMSGGTLEFTMTDTPANAFTIIPKLGNRVDSVAAPYIALGPTSRMFMGTATLAATIYYAIDGGAPTEKSTRYIVPFRFYQKSATSIVRAIAIDENGNRSKVAEAHFKKRPNDWTVKIISPYSTQYAGGGDDAIVDGIRGTTNFASGEWQGYQGKTFEAVIDMRRPTEIKSVGGSFLQAARSWIWMPDRIEFETSQDGIHFAPLTAVKPAFPVREMEPVMREFREAIHPMWTRFVRVKAYNFGKIPAWHPGAGGDPWIFVDEILID
ncbi:MAG: GH92 family glycosyl hydrolase, partial [Acidobacteriota bacterium]